MQAWPHPICSYTPEEVQQFCVQDVKWQEFRMSLKGLPTPTKLDKLDQYYYDNTVLGHKNPRIQIQTSNYINALKRGGLLSMDLRVQR